MHRALQNARAAYASDPSVVDNVPDFGSWLTDPLSIGYRFNTAITGYRSQLDSELDLLDTLIQQSNDPTIKRAPKVWRTISTGPVSTHRQHQGCLYVLPSYKKEESYVDWVRNVQAGGGQQGHLAWANSEAYFDWKKAWAGGYAGVRTPFWGIKVGGSWERADWLATGSDISVELNLQAWDTI